MNDSNQHPNEACIEAEKEKLIVEQLGELATYPASFFFEYIEGALFIYEDGINRGCTAIYPANQWTKVYYTGGLSNG